MTIKQFQNTAWGAGLRVHCNPMCMQYESYVAYVVSVDFDQCLIGVMRNIESEDEDVRWLRCENCDIVAELNTEKENPCR